MKMTVPAMAAPSTVAVTGTAPAPAGEMAVHIVELEHETPVAALAPNKNDVLPGATSKPRPMNVAVVPPAAGPVVGEIEFRPGGAMYVNVTAPLAGMPSTLPLTATVPVPAGEAPVHVVLVEHVTPVAATPPNAKVVRPAVVSKPLPLNVTLVPPPSGPDAGEIEVRDAMYVNVGDPLAGALSTVAVTLTVPMPAGDVPVHWVEDEQVTEVAAEPPNMNDVAPGAGSKAAPEKVTDVPPAAGPEDGEIELKVGTAGPV